MHSITISIDEELLKSGRRYAAKHQTSLNALIRTLLEQTVKADSTHWVEECFALMDRAKGCSKGKRWKREDLYDVKFCGPKI
jgi:ribonuclease D